MEHIICLYWYKKTHLWPIALFHVRRPKFCLPGNRRWKNIFSRNFADVMSQVTARRPFVVKKPFFGYPSGRHRLCLLRHVLTVKLKLWPSLTYGLSLVVNLIKLTSAIAGKVIMQPFIYVHLGKKLRFWTFLRGVSGLFRSQNTFETSS